MYEKRPIKETHMYGKRNLCVAHFTRSFIVGLVEGLCFSECVLGIRV